MTSISTSSEFRSRKFHNSKFFAADKQISVLIIWDGSSVFAGTHS